MHGPRPRLSLLALGSLLFACKPPAAAPVDEPQADPKADDSAAATGEAFEPELVERPLEGDALAVTVHRLKNGITVYISPNPREPRVATRVVVRVGSASDPADSTGLAHYLEHMLFKGSDELGVTDAAAEAPHLERIAALYDELRRKPENRAQILAQIDAQTLEAAKYAIPNEFDQLYASLGVEGVNAYTSSDATVYIADVPANRIGAWAKVEAERFADARFRLFYPELEAVYEEKNLSLDSPAERASDALDRALFPGFPYGTQTTIGEVEHLKNPAYADMTAFFERYYQPQNLAIVLAGDVEASEVLPLLEREFGSIEARDDQRVRKPPGSLEGPSGRVEREVVGEGEETVQIGWRTVAARHADEPVLAVMDLLMDNATSGLINLELEQTQKVPDAGSYHDARTHAGAYKIYATARSGQSLDEVEGLLLGTVDRLKSGGFSQQDIDAIVLNDEIERKAALPFNGARVSRIEDAFIHGIEWKQAVEREATLAGVTKQQVVDAANRYLGDDFAVVKRRRGSFEPPRIDKPTISPVPIKTATRSAFFGAVAAIPATPIEPESLEAGTDYEQLQAPSGMMFWSPNDAHDLFNLSYQWELGFRRQPELCMALTLLESSGTQAKTPAELTKALYALGTSISIRCNADRTSVSVSGIDRNYEASLALLDEWFSQPVLEQRTREALVDNVLTSRRDMLDDSEVIARAARDYARFGKRSGWLAQPSNEEISSFTIAQMDERIGSLFGLEHETLYWGPRSAQEVIETAASRKTKAVEPEPRRAFERVRGKTRFVFVDRPTAKTQFTVTMPLSNKARDREAAEVLSTYFSGDMGALIFQEMREARGLVYRAWADVSVGRRPRDQWSLDAAVSTQADKTLQAMEVLLELMGRPIDESRLEISKSTLLEQQRAERTGPGSAVWRAWQWFHAGFEGDPRKQRFARIAQIEAEDLGWLLERASGPALVSIVGPADSIDLEALKRAGTLIEMEPDELFGF